MSNSIVKLFDQAEIRFVQHAEGKYSFGMVAEDLATVLEHSNSSVMAGAVKDKWKGVNNVYSLGGTQSMTVIWEPGIYELLAKSRKPKAQPFQEWLFEEVLPSIRKTGKYEVAALPQLPVHEVAVLKADAIAHITDVLSLNHPRLAQLLIDHTISDIMSAKQIGGVRLRGVVEIAEDLGFKCDHSSRSQLGKFVANSEVTQLKQSEERLVNGTVRPVNCYPDTDEVRAVIRRFFR